MRNLVPQEKAGFDHRPDLRRHHHLQAFGQRDEAAVPQDVGAPLGIVRTGELIAHAEFADELLRPRLHAASQLSGPVSRMQPST
jgi:hypothetical protein